VIWRSSCLLLLLAAVLVSLAPSAADSRTLHFPVTVSVTGPGRVTGAGDGGSIDCPGQCSAMINQNTPITLTATPDPGSRFTTWGGSCTEAGTSNVCTVTMTGPKSVTAGFDTAPPPPPMFTLTASKIGTGTGYVGGAGGIDCGPTCSASLQAGTAFSLVAVPDDGSTFGGWSGPCTGTGPCALTVDADTTVTATFDRVDRSPPRVSTLPGTARRGKTAKLRYRVSDDSGRSREQLTVLEGARSLARVSVPMGQVVYRRIYTARWHVPKTLEPGAHTFCAVAIDPTGNRSKRSCSKLRIM
jgi:Divergent InlB B-repeat domain